MSTASPAAAQNYRAHPTALVETPHVGARTRIWAFAHLLPTCRVGEDCNICDHVLVEDGAVIGDRVTVKCYVQVGDGITLEDDVFVGPNVGFTNDPYPRSRQWSEEYAKTLVRRGASIGANASILPGLTIGAGAMVGAGAVVTKDVPAHAIVVGNPAYVKGYVGEGGKKPDPILEKLLLEKLPPRVLPGGARLVRLPETCDTGGVRNAFSLEDLIPFTVARYELVHRVPARAVRGENAFKTMHQFLVPVNGGCKVRLFDGTRSGEVRLDRRDQALYIPPMTWASQFAFTSDAAILIFKSNVGSEHAGDEFADEIRESSDYLRMLPSA